MNDCVRLKTHLRLQCCSWRWTGFVFHPPRSSSSQSFSVCSGGFGCVLGRAAGQTSRAERLGWTIQRCHHKLSRCWTNQQHLRAGVVQPKEINYKQHPQSLGLLTPQPTTYQWGFWKGWSGGRFGGGHGGHWGPVRFQDLFVFYIYWLTLLHFILFSEQI